MNCSIIPMFSKLWALHTNGKLEPSKPEYRERRLDNDRSAKIDTFAVPIGAPTP